MTDQRPNQPNCSASAYFSMKSTAALSRYPSPVPAVSAYDRQAVSAMTSQHLNKPASQTASTSSSSLLCLSLVPIQPCPPLTGDRVRRDRSTPKPAQLFRKRLLFHEVHSRPIPVPFPSTSRVRHDRQAVSSMTGQHLNQPASQTASTSSSSPLSASPWYPSSRIRPGQS